MAQVRRRDRRARNGFAHPRTIVVPKEGYAT